MSAIFFILNFSFLILLTPAVTPLTDKPPSELSGGIASRLTPAAKVVTGDATLEIWLVQAIEGAARGWGGVDSGTLVGAIRVTGAYKEIRGKVVRPGVYTLRYGQQPQNGDHLGISQFREFLLLSPAAIDTDAKVLGFDGVVALSKEVIGTAHPASLSLDPPEDAPGAVHSPYKNDLGHDGVVLQAGLLKFGLIVSGLIVH